MGRFVLAFSLLLLVASRALSADGEVGRAEIMVLRLSERMVVALSGTLLLFLGYRLFAKAADLGSLTAEVPDRIKLQMQRVGPGVFFALFGTAILIHVMASPIELTGSPSEAGGIRFGGELAAAMSDNDKAAQSVRALEIVRNSAVSGVRPTTPAAIQELNDAVGLLTELQASLVDHVVGPGAYAEWSFINAQEQKDPDYRSKLSADSRSRSEQVIRILEEGEP